LPRTPRRPASERAITVTIPQACELTGLGRSTIYLLIDDGELERIKVRERALVTMDSIKRLLAGKRQG